MSRPIDGAPRATPSRRAPRGAQVPPADLVIAETRAWVNRAVIGLNLCPFAKAVEVKGRVRYCLSLATREGSLREELIAELKRLASSPPEQFETTLLIHPYLFNRFAAYNAFLPRAERILTELLLEGVIQIASFHPHYRFAGSAADDIANATNRSPYPLLHLLREDSVARAVAAVPDPGAIFETNIATMRQLGARAWASLRRQCTDDARSAAGDEPAPPAPGR